MASVLCGPCGPCKYATKEGHVISDAFVESVIPNIHAIFGSDISQVLVLPLLWASYEGACTVNEFTFPLIPIAMAQEIKGKWISGGGSPSDNPIEKIGLAIQQLGDQLVVVPLVHPCVGGISNNYSLPEPSNSHHTYVPMEDEAPAAGTSTAITNDSHVLFSQQFLMQQQVKDLRQEFLAAFANQRRFLQQMNGGIQRIASQPVIRPVARQFGTPTLEAVRQREVPAVSHLVFCFNF